MVYSLVVRTRGLEYGGREFESQSLNLKPKPETDLCEERGLSGCRKGLKTVPLAQALLSLKPAKTKKINSNYFHFFSKKMVASLQSSAQLFGYDIQRNCAKSSTIFVSIVRLVKLR